MSVVVDLQDERILRACNAVIDAIGDHLGFGGKLRTSDVALTLIKCLLSMDKQVPGFSRKAALLVLKMQDASEVSS